MIIVRDGRAHKKFVTLHVAMTNNKHFNTK